jgi:hypothetical protein
MGGSFTDAYSLLHFATGVVARHWGAGLLFWTILHTLFEILENTKQGMYFINTYITAWPGGKSAADSLLNNIGDTVYAILGWIAADMTLK